MNIDDEPDSWFLDQAMLLRQDRPAEATLCAHKRHRHQWTLVEMPPWVQPFEMMTFPPEEYRDTSGYCCGDDDVSRTLAIHGRWEQHGTEVFLRCLNHTPDGGVIDFGPQLGWYSLLAMRAGREVLAIEAVLEHLEMLSESAQRLPRHNLNMARHWVGPESPVLPSGQRIAMAKIDLEGNDEFAVAMLDNLLLAGEVENLMIEISPVFNDSYFDLLTYLLETYHFHAAVIDPWKPFTAADIGRVIDDAPQFDVILSRNPYWS